METPTPTFVLARGSLNLNSLSMHVDFPLFCQGKGMVPSQSKLSSAAISKHDAWVQPGLPFLVFLPKLTFLQSNGAQGCCETSGGRSSWISLPESGCWTICKSYFFGSLKIFLMCLPVFTHDSKCINCCSLAALCM